MSSLNFGPTPLTLVTRIVPVHRLARQDIERRSIQHIIRLLLEKPPRSTWSVRRYNKCSLSAGCDPGEAHLLFSQGTGYREALGQWKEYQRLSQQCACKRVCQAPGELRGTGRAKVLLHKTQSVRYQSVKPDNMRNVLFAKMSSFLH